MMFYDSHDEEYVPVRVHNDQIDHSEDLLSFNIALGASFRFVITNLQDEKIVEVGGQLPQQAHGALLPPYIHLGVGRSNNYIESFNVATVIKNKLLKNIKTPIIPNSQLIIVYETGQENSMRSQVSK